MNRRFSVIQIGDNFYVSFTGRDLHTGEIQTGPLFLAKRFQWRDGANVAADLIRANKEFLSVSVTVKTCGIVHEVGE